MTVERREFLFGMFGAGLGFFCPKSVRAIFDIQNNPVPPVLLPQHILRELENSLLSIRALPNINKIKHTEVKMRTALYEAVDKYLGGLFGRTEKGFIYHSVGLGAIEIVPTDGQNTVRGKLLLPNGATPKTPQIYEEAIMSIEPLTAAAKPYENRFTFVQPMQETRRYFPGAE